MFDARTLRILAALVAGYALVALPAYVGPALLEEIAAVAVIVPYLSVHLFHRLGIPGLLEHGGFCGWGLCAPSIAGWIFMVVLWIALAWLLAFALARLISRRPPP